MSISWGKVREVVFGAQLVHAPQRGRFNHRIDPLMPDRFGRRGCGQPLRHLFRSHGNEADRDDLARVAEALRVEHYFANAVALVGGTSRAGPV